MGYTTLSAGQVLTASHMNNEVRDQVISKFSTTAARDAAIGSPAEPMEVAITGEDRGYVYNGSAWVRNSNWWSTSGRTGTRLRRAANQSMTSGGFTAISWDTEDADADGFITVTSSTITIPTGLGGIYSLIARVDWGATPTGPSLLLAAGGQNYTYPYTNVSLGSPVVWIGQLAAADTIVISPYHTTGVGVNITARLELWRLNV